MAVSIKRETGKIKKDSNKYNESKNIYSIELADCLVCISKVEAIKQSKEF